MESEQIGKWSFILGLVVALVTGFTTIPQAGLILFVLGLLVGFLNISAKETEKFLIAAIALIALGVASIGSLAVLGAQVSTALNAILASVIALVGGAALVVSLKSIYELSNE